MNAKTAKKLRREAKKKLEQKVGPEVYNNASEHLRKKALKKTYKDLKRGK